MFTTIIEKFIFPDEIVTKKIENLFGVSLSVKKLMESLFGTDVKDWNFQCNADGALSSSMKIPSISLKAFKLPVPYDTKFGQQTPFTSIGYFPEINLKTMIEAKIVSAAIHSPIHDDDDLEECVNAGQAISTLVKILTHALYGTFANSSDFARTGLVSYMKYQRNNYVAIRIPQEFVIDDPDFKEPTEEEVEGSEHLEDVMPDTITIDAFDTAKIITLKDHKLSKTSMYTLLIPVNWSKNVDYNKLISLSDDDHPQYFNISSPNWNSLYTSEGSNWSVTNVTNSNETI